jgi:hypothetical protein
VRALAKKTTLRAKVVTGLDSLKWTLTLLLLILGKRLKD